MSSSSINSSSSVNQSEILSATTETDDINSQKLEAIINSEIPKKLDAALNKVSSQLQNMQQIIEQKIPDGMVTHSALRPRPDNGNDDSSIEGKKVLTDSEANTARMTVKEYNEQLKHHHGKPAKGEAVKVLQESSSTQKNIDDLKKESAEQFKHDIDDAHNRSNKTNKDEAKWEKEIAAAHNKIDKILHGDDTTKVVEAAQSASNSSKAVEKALRSINGTMSKYLR